MVSSSISFLYLQTNFCFLFLANQIFISEPIFLRRNNFRFRFLWKKSSKICLKSELKFFPPPLKKNLREVVFFVVHKLTFVLTIGIVTKIILKLSWLRKKLFCYWKRKKTTTTLQWKENKDFSLVDDKRSICEINPPQN